MESSVMVALSSNIVPVQLNAHEEVDKRFKMHSYKTIVRGVKESRCDNVAYALQPFHENEIILWEMRINKKAILWTDEEYRQFEDYFARKYKLKELLKVAV